MMIYLTVAIVAFPVRLPVRRPDPAGVVLTRQSGAPSRPKELKR